MPEHNHPWEPLYRAPAPGSDVRTAYEGDNLKVYFVCPECSAIGRSYDKEIKVLDPELAAAHRNRAARWNAELAG